MRKKIKYFDARIIFEFMIKGYNKNQDLSKIGKISIAMFSLLVSLSSPILRASVG
jgi:hypothetical protein